MNTPEHTIPTRFYHGLPQILDMFTDIALQDGFDARTSGYIRSCAEAATVSLSDISETLALLAMVNRHYVPPSSQVDLDKVSIALQEITLLNAGLLPLLTEIAGSCGHASGKG
ncbi:MAG: hypothetical protein Q4G28_01800 [Neisseria sp.]|nr:hypothetical protein [Neisseria sp.]